MLVVCEDAALSSSPTLRLEDNEEVRIIDSIKLVSWQGYGFYRFQFHVGLSADSRTVVYEVQLPGVKDRKGTVEQKRCVEIAAAGTPWRWMFYSCNGHHDAGADSDYGGVEHLWTDVLQQHEQQPYSLLVGLGDQLYNDQVFEVEGLKGWDQLADRSVAVQTPFTGTIQERVEEFYFSHYCYHFSYGQYGNALATIPSINTWDDHDIYDGYGSYPKDLQECAIMQGVYASARLFYLLFQQHTTDQRAKEEDAEQFFGTKTALHTLSMLGSSTAILAPDTRSERSLTQIVPAADWDVIFQRINDLPPSVRHLIMVMPVPLVYPHVKHLENLLKKIDVVLDSLPGFFHGLSRKLSRFGDVKWIDDLADGWHSAEHVQECESIISRLVELVTKRALRVTFISGDVHLAAVGVLLPRDVERVQEQLLRRERRYFSQITSSAIGNQPQPRAVAAMYAEAAEKPWSMTEGMQGSLLKISDQDWAKDGVLGLTRNWCSVHETGWDGSDISGLDGHLTFSLRFEDPAFRHDNSKTQITTFEHHVPICDLEQTD